MKLCLAVGCFLLLACGLAFSADPAQKDNRNIEEFPPPGVNPPLVPSEYVWFFGYIPKDGWVTHHYSMTNNHEDTVTITKLIPGCDCTQLPRVPIVVPPGESRLIEVGFNTKTYSGETNRDVHVITDFAENPNMDLFFASMVGYQPRTVKVTPPSTVFIAGKEKQTFSVANLLDSEVKVRILIDNDSTMSVTETEFTLDEKESMEFSVLPDWKKLEYGPKYKTIAIEFERGTEIFRVSIPIKSNKF